MPGAARRGQEGARGSNKQSRAHRGRDLRRAPDLIDRRLAHEQYQGFASNVSWMLL